MMFMTWLAFGLLGRLDRTYTRSAVITREYQDLMPSQHYPAGDHDQPPPPPPHAGGRYVSPADVEAGRDQAAAGAVGNGAGVWHQPVYLPPAGAAPPIKG